MNKRPHNPGVRELIAAKRQGHYRQTREDGRRGFRGWHERFYLPHFDAPGRTQFVTFRLAGSFPATRRSEWAALLEIEDNRERQKKLEAYLDLGHGEAYLRRPDVAQLIESALLFFHGQRYELRAWVVMPNHVHALFNVGEVSMENIVASWKSYTANEANKLLKRQGRFWQPDYWDTYMRDAQHEAKSVRYIENNPIKANLGRGPKDWQWSSAKFRDEYGRLVLPARCAAFQAAALRKPPEA